MIELDFIRADVKQNFDGDYEVTLIVPRGSRIGVQRLYDQIRTNVSKGKHMIAKIGEKRNRRSLDANAYLWVLCDKIAEAIRSTKEEVYIEGIRSVGRFEQVPIRDDAVDFWISAWEGKGLGWYAEPSHKAKTDGYTIVRTYYGSSAYDSKDMSRLIDHIVDEAKGLGIETKTPAELEILKQEWR